MFGNPAKRQLKEIGRRVLVNPKDGRQAQPGLDMSQRLDRERVKNMGDEEIPAYGVMQITAWASDADGLYEVEKPTSDDGEPLGYLINGREAIAVDAVGWGHWVTIRPVLALIDAAAMALGDECGPTADSFELSAAGTGYQLASEEIGDTPKRALVKLLPAAADTDCPEFDCGLAVGVALPRTTATGVLRMFRGKRPDTAAALTKTNRPEKELQIGVGYLGRWLPNQTSRWLMPGMPPNSASEPDPEVNVDSQASVGFLVPELRRHLVTRRTTEFRGAVEYDYSPPGFQGWVYVLGHETVSMSGDSVVASGGAQHLALRFYDGLLVAGRAFRHSGSGNVTWNNFSAPAALTSELHGGSVLTYFDGGCCPKYDADSQPDIYQGPSGFGLGA